MNSYDEYLAELEAERKARVRAMCNQGTHTWSHYYNFARCGDCGKTRDISTAQENAQL